MLLTRFPLPGTGRMEDATSASNVTETKFANYDGETDGTSAAATFFMYKIGTYLFICLLQLMCL